MSYTALYRKWRPDSFADVKGQEHIVTTLRNQIESDRIGHAYLFCGTRGTGKTTVAKILAKAVNCKSPVEGSPCGECDICKAISAGASLNVMEIDAASNNGVDNIRQIREEVEYRPTEGKYKVYIIDEVHMLSIGAFNALLKTLEEPPEYVIFILATTEAHKIPVTIMSRCQRYDFKRISVETITDRLKELTVAEGAQVEDKALKYIARMADGAMRDALSLLDRCMAFYIGKELRYEDVLEVLGTVDTEVFSEMMRLILNENITGIIKLLDKIVYEGRDIGQFISDFTWYMRNIMMLKASPESEGMIDMSKENLDRLKEEAMAVEMDTVMRYIRILSELSNSLKFSTQKRVLVEVAFIKMTRPQMESDLASITERLRRMEELVKEKEDILALTAIRPEVPVGAISQPSVIVPAETKQHIKALPEDLAEIARNWNGIISRIEEPDATLLRTSRLTPIDGKLVIFPESSWVRDRIMSGGRFENLMDAIESACGKTVELEVRMLDEGKSFDDQFEDVRDFIKNIDINYED